MEIDHKKIVFVYSALHTGTWFACEALAAAATHHQTKADKWSRDAAGVIYEDLKYPNGLTFLKAQQILDDCEFNSGDTGDAVIEHESDVIIFQAHQRSDSNLYHALSASFPEIPVVIPMRDPLLSLNTRIWREAGSIEGLKEEPEETRIYRVENQLASIKRILEIPQEHVFVLPIDIPKLVEEKNRVGLLSNLVTYCGIGITSELVEYAQNWMPVNPTPAGANPQRKHHPINDDDFVKVKNMILQRRFKAVSKILKVEIPYLQSFFKKHFHLKVRLEELGYSDLLWW